jgi:sec-independent protein translocase protein TatA
MIGSEELILIFVIILFLFGPTKLPELAKSLGSALGEFKRAQLQSEINMKELDNIASSRTPIASTRTPEMQKKIQDTAEKLGIDITGKTDDQILDEMQHAGEKPEVS